MLLLIWFLSLIFVVISLTNEIRQHSESTSVVPASIIVGSMFIFIFYHSYQHIIGH